MTEDGTIVVSGVAASCYLYEEHSSLLHFTTSISNALLDVVGMTSKLTVFPKRFCHYRNACRWPCAYRVACDVAIAEDVRLSDWRSVCPLYASEDCSTRALSYNANLASEALTGSLIAFSGLALAK